MKNLISSIVLDVEKTREDMFKMLQNIAESEITQGKTKFAEAFVFDDSNDESEQTTS